MSRETEIQNAITRYEKYRKDLAADGRKTTWLDNRILLLKAGISTRAIHAVFNGARRANMPDFALDKLGESDLMTWLKRIADGELDSVILDMRNSGPKTLAEWKTGAERLVDRSAEYYAMYI